MRVRIAAAPIARWATYAILAAILVSPTAQKALAERGKPAPLSAPTDLNKRAEDASRGLLATIEGNKIVNPDGSIAADVARYDFISGASPETVNPMLWRQSILNNNPGLFEVTKGVYQFRGYDAANMTLIAGKSGWIVVDVLSSEATVRAGIELANQTVGQHPVSAVVITHSHADHFAGIGAIKDFSKVDVPVYAPKEFFQEVVSENLLAGPAMFGRARYQLGVGLSPGAEGHVGYGLSQFSSRGPRSVARPTLELAEAETEMQIDGVTFQFLDASGTEATSELVFFLPEFKVLDGAEVVTGVQHNLLTPRGAKVRDALIWSNSIDKMIVKFGAQTEFLISSHNAPYFGNDTALEHLKNHRNLYRYIHDQTLRLANNGMTMHEIADSLPEPRVMQTDISTRPLYGSYRHNIRAVYQNYLGWWDGVPAHLNPLPPEESSARYVELMGGSEAVLTEAHKSFQSGDLRWAATLLNHLVFADPDNNAAHKSLAEVYRQLGFQEESGAFRDFFLTAAAELDGAPPPSLRDFSINSNLPIKDQADLTAVRFHPDKFDHSPFTLNVTFSDSDERLSLDVGPDVIFPRLELRQTADHAITLKRHQWAEIVNGTLDISDIDTSPDAQSALFALVASLDTFDGAFNIAQP